MRDLLAAIVGDDIPIRIVTPDGETLGPEDSATTVRILSPNAIHRIVTARGQELGFARALVAGEMVVEGDIFGLFGVTNRIAKPTLDMALLKPAAEALGLKSVKDVARLRPLPPPPEEFQLSGRLHSKARDAEAIASHYDVANEFYQLLLGPSMTYSCALFEEADYDLETAQAAKHDLISRKLALAPGKRLLDIGCGWGSMAIHAASNYGVEVVGVTISQDQFDLANKRVHDAGVADLVTLRLQDYRDVNDGPFDAISSIGMAEHVGDEKQLRGYFDHVSTLLAPGGRFLNHAISRSPRHEQGGKDSFIQRYVFPDGKLHEIGRSTSLVQDAGFEARHMETLRLHYAKTLRFWLANLEANWDEAVSIVGEGRALIWRLYIGGSAFEFERGNIQIHQILAVHEDTEQELPLRPDW